MAMETVRLPNGEEVVFDEWLHFPQYSTVEWASTAAVNMRAFTYVAGQRVPSIGLTARIADESDTNQVAKGRMNWDESYRVFSMTYENFALSDGTISLSPNTITTGESPVLTALNLRRMQRDLVIELIVGADIEKPQVRAPFSYFHQGIGCWAYGSGDRPDSLSAVSYGTGGEPRWSSQRRYPFPVKIGSDNVMYLKIFSATSTISGLSQDVRQRWYMDGVKRRPLG
jgi:hypothetical protein